MNMEEGSSVEIKKFDEETKEYITIDLAPSAPRPEWLPLTGVGQRNVDPLCWSLTVRQWIMIYEACRETETWKVLAHLRGGEENINMYDIRDYFIIPWTKGTGCSMAILLNGRNINDQSRQSFQVDCMISHAWHGSAVESRTSMRHLLHIHKVPESTPMFFCTFSMYQPEDGAVGGLSIDEQLKRRPFAHIIESYPRYGMFVVHTSLYEVYLRLWTVHEADEAAINEVPVRGIFDLKKQSQEKLAKYMFIKSEKGECRPEDREMLKELIQSRGGFDRLDQKIADFRSNMINQFLEQKKIAEDEELNRNE